MGVTRRSRAGGRAVRRSGGTLRIATSYLDGTANAYYRAVLPLRELERRGHRVLWPARHDYGELLSGRPSFDVFVIHHFFGETVSELVRRLGREGVAVVWDKDDDISATPRHAPAYKVYGGRRGIKRGFARSIEIASQASMMTTPSAHLAGLYRNAGAPHVEVIENYVAPEHLDGVRSRHQGVVIGVTASGEHGEDFKRLKVDQTLRRLLRTHEGVRVVTIGWGHDLPPGRHVHHPRVPIEGLIEVEQEFDIGLAPLADSVFNRARSNIKLKEYAAAGAMWLASPVGPYVGMGEEQGGVLVPDDAWYATLERFVLDFRARVALAERARAWVRRQSSEHAAGRWETVFTQAVARARTGAARGVGAP